MNKFTSSFYKFTVIFFFLKMVIIFSTIFQAHKNNIPSSDLVINFMSLHTVLVDLSLLETWAGGVHLMGASLGQGAHCELEGRAWNMHALVLDADGVDAHLFGHKLDVVGAVVQVHDVAQLGDARGARYRSLHVKRTRTWNRHNRDNQLSGKLRVKKPNWLNR